MATLEYPKKSVLRNGVILSAIVNSTKIAQSSWYARFCSWDGKNYVLNLCDGTLGAITFDGDSVVGVFFDVESKHNPFASKQEYNINRFLLGMPDNHRRLAETRTLRYNRQDYRGQVVSIVTAAFWDKGQFLTAAFPWSEVLENGAHIIRVELMEDLEAALEEWQDAYQMSKEQMAFARSLFERRLADGEKAIKLNKSEMEWLKATSEDPEAMEDCRKAFAAIGIQVV